MSGMAAGVSDAQPPASDRGGRRGHPVRWAMIAVALLILVPGVVVLGNQLGKDPSLVPSVVVGRPAPEFSLATLDGGTISSADLRGRPYVVNFWASWCVPCREENGYLDDFYRQYKPRGVELLGVIFEDTPRNARSFRREMGGDWPLLIDPNGRLAVDFGLRGVPETFIVDATGTITAMFPGAIGPGSLERYFAESGIAAPSES